MAVLGAATGEARSPDELDAARSLPPHQLAAVAAARQGARQVAPNQFRFADGVLVTRYRSGRRGSFCGARRFCVWADAGYQGIQASFPRCAGNRPKSYQLRKYGLRPGKPGWVFSGVTSWRNNMPASKNDEAAWVDMLCVP